ncbi:MAG: gliding motility-associated C-terminal domain-containing protein, partial [Saprospiraceae bacterium]
LNSSAAPSVAISNLVQPACGQNNGSLTAQGSGGTSPYQYSLDGVNFQASGTFSNLAAGNYTVTVRDVNGCTAQQPVGLNNNSTLIVNLIESTTPDCQENNGAIRVNAQGGFPPYTFSIDGTIFQSSALFDNLGSGFYVVYCRDGQGCLSTLEVTLSDPSEGLTPAQAGISTTIICPDEPFQLSGNLPQGTSGSWSDASGNVFFTAPASATSMAIIASPGNYTLTWTLSALSCENYSSSSVQVTVIAAPVAQQDGPLAVNSQALEIPILNNDSHQTDVTVTIIAFPLQGIATISEENSITYTPNADANGFDTLIYQICHVDCALLCDTAIVLFSNITEVCDLSAAPDNVFPEGITPNADGYNERLEFIVVDPTSCPFNYAKSELIIFNRWGDRVFQAAPYNNDWNGRSQNGDLPAGVYYYVLKVKLEQEFVKFGNISIFR